MKSKDKSNWTCSDALQKKDPCPGYQVYQLQRGRNPKPFAVMSDTIDRREVALTTYISFKGKHQWFNGEITFLDLGGCENVVNSQFAKTKLHLPIIRDDSLNSWQLKQSVIMVTLLLL